MEQIHLKCFTIKCISYQKQVPENILSLAFKVESDFKCNQWNQVTGRSSACVVD